MGAQQWGWWIWCTVLLTRGRQSYFNPLPHGIGSMGPTLFKAKILQNLWSIKNSKNSCIPWQIIFLKFVTSGNLKKQSFIAVLHGFIGPTPRMLGQLLWCHTVRYDGVFVLVLILRHGPNRIGPTLARRKIQRGWGRVLERPLNGPDIYDVF